MLKFICVKWGEKYSADYVNILYSMISKNIDVPFKLYCYTDIYNGIDQPIEKISINSSLKGWWPKLDLLKIFTEGDMILLDLDIVILKKLEILPSIKTRTLSILPSQWKNNYFDKEKVKGYPTLYNSSIMKWQDSQGLEVYEYFIKHKQKIFLKYPGIDRFLYNEPVDVDTLPSSIAYSYWRGKKHNKDTEIGKLRPDYEICILNEGIKNHEIESWIHDYWK